MHLDFPLYPKQHSFVISDKREVAFIGGIGSGKTRGLCIKALLKALNNPGSVGCITAPTYPMLRDSTKRTFFEVCPYELLAFRNDTENIVGIRTATGQVSEIFFRSTHEPDHLRGPNLVWAALDEASLSTREAYLILIGRLRAGDPAAQQLFTATTPKGLNWVYELFGPQVSVPNREAYYSSTRENIFLPSEYVHSVYGLYDGSFAQQELEGKFIPYEGLIYGDLFDYSLHVGSFPYQSKYNVDLAWDFGYPNPEAVLAIQQDGAGRVFVIDEAYRLKTLTEDIVADLKSKPWFENVSDCIADEARPDMILRLQGLGVPARPSRKGKINDGIAKVRSLLTKDSVTDQPILHIDKRCASLLQEFSLYRWADKRTETDEWKEKPIDAYNHALDGLRYWVVDKWFPTTQVKPSDRKKPKRRVMAFQYL